MAGYVARPDSSMPRRMWTARAHSSLLAALIKSELDHVRLHDVDPLCFPTTRGSHSSSTGWFLHENIQAYSIIREAPVSYRNNHSHSNMLNKPECPLIKTGNEDYVGETQSLPSQRGKPCPPPPPLLADGHRSSPAAVIIIRLVLCVLTQLNWLS